MDQVDLLPTGKSVLSKPTSELLDAFGAGKASPGSGSAAALMGLLSAKLILTVCTKSLEKQTCADSFKVFEYLASQIKTEIEPQLKRLFEVDARDFDKVVSLRKLALSATDAQEKSKHSREANDLLEVATDYSIEVAELCMKLIDHGIVIFNNGWHAVRGDSGASISAAIAGVMSCIFIINLNLKTLKDRKYSQSKLAKCKELYATLQSKQESAFGCVTSISAEAIDAVQLQLGN